MGKRTLYIWNGLWTDKKDPSDRRDDDDDATTESKSTTTTSNNSGTEQVEREHAFKAGFTTYG